MSELLPSGYFAEERVHVGPRVEIDVATFDNDLPVANSGTNTAVSLATRPWTAPPATFSWPALFPDSLEVLVFSGESGPTLVAAVELVSPSNKDRPAERRAFAAKCAAYLQQGVGLAVVDIVTARTVNLHEELASLLQLPKQAWPHGSLYATAYRPLLQEEQGRIDVWTEGLAIGQSLPVMPLALDRGLVVPLHLESTYNAVCQRRRIAQYPRPVV